jgi:hypothetical protein
VVSFAEVLPRNVTTGGGPLPLTCWEMNPIHVGDAGFTISA